MDGCKFRNHQIAAVDSRSISQEKNTWIQKRGAKGLCKSTAWGALPRLQEAKEEGLNQAPTVDGCEVHLLLAPPFRNPGLGFDSRT